MILSPDDDNDDTVVKDNNEVEEVDTGRGDGQRIRKTTLYLLGLDHLSSLEKSLDSLWHLKVQPQFHLKLKTDPSEPK